MIKKNKKIKRYIAMLLAIIMGAFSFSGFSLDVQAASKSILEIATVPEDGDKMPAKYEFIAKFTEASKLTTFGSGWKDVTAVTDVQGTNFPAVGVIPTNSQKGKNGVIYSNVGAYKGHVIDLKITIMDWKAFGSNVGNIGYGKDRIGHMQDGYEWVDQKWEFLDSETGEPVEVNGYMTIADIDFSQRITFSKETSESMTDIYVSGTDNWIKFDDKNGEYSFYEEKDKESKDDDLFAMFTFTYSNSSFLQFKWGCDIANPNRIYNKDKLECNYFVFTAKKPMESETAMPTKTVTDSDETRKQKNILSDRNEKFTYEVVHFVPDEWETNYYKNYIFSDEVLECLEILDFRIETLGGEKITERFNTAIKNNKVTASAKNLKDSNFYYQYYVFILDVKIRNDADITSYKSGEEYIFKNKAVVNIDNDKIESNEVDTIYKYKIGEDSIIKKIVDGNKHVEELQVTENRDVRLYGKASFSDGKPYKSVQIVDKLDPALRYKSFEIYDSNNKDIFDKGKLDVKDNVLTFTFNDDYLLSIMGNEVYFYIDTELDITGDFERINDAILNTYDLVLEGYPMISNEVKIYIPLKDSNIDKVISVNGKESKKIVLDDNTQNIDYVGKIQVTNTEAIDNIVLEDILHKAFKFVDLAVYDAAGNNITDKGTRKVTGQTVQFTFSGDYAKSLVGKELSWKITVKYIEGSDLSDLKDCEIPNIMSLYVNGKKKDSDEVIVKPNPLKNSIGKSVIGADGNKTNSYKLQSNTEKFKVVGDIQVNNTEKIKNIILEDVLHDAFEFVDYKVYDNQNRDITAQGERQDSGRKLQFYIPDSYAKNLVGQTLRWEITLKYIEGSDLSGLNNCEIPNTMRLYVNGATTDSNKVVVIPEPLVDSFYKRVMDGVNEVKKLELSNNNEEITFIGRGQVNNTNKIKEIILEDVLHDAFKYIRANVYDADGNNITGKGKLEQNGQKITFKISGDYAAQFVGQKIYWKITVKYVEGSDLSALENNEIPNTMRLIVNEKNTDTDKVVVIPEPLPNEMLKSILGADGNLVQELKLDDNTAEIQFQGDILFSNEHPISYAALEDSLHQAFEYVGMNIFDEKGKSVMEWGTEERDGNTVRFIFSEDYYTKLIGKPFVWEITVKYIEGSDLSALENNSIPNVMNLLVNEDNYVSPPVIVTPEPQKDSVEKHVYDADGKLAKKYVLEDNAMPVKFRGDIVINNIEEIKSVVLKDNLHEAFKCIDLFVYDADGNDIAEHGEKIITEHGAEFIFSEEYAKLLVGKKISWEVVVEYIEGSDLSALPNHSIPNIMNLIVNEKEVESDEVTVTPVPLKSEINKFIVDPEGNWVTSLKLSNNSEIFTFTGVATVANDETIQSFVLRDNVDTALAVNKSSVKVSDANGEDLTGLGKVELDDNNTLTYTVTENAQSFAGKVLNWQFDAALNDDVDTTEERKIENEMEMDVNGDTKKSDPVDITTKAEPEPEIETDGKGTVPKTGDQTTMLGIALLGLSGLIVAIYLFIKKRKNAKKSID